MIVDNKPGASGVIGNDFVAKAVSDGYTVLLAISAIVQVPALKKLPYDVMKAYDRIIEDANITLD